MWRNVLADEGRNIAKRAEKAQDAGDCGTARELYLKAAAKFRAASEISEDFNEISIQRSLESYYTDRAVTLEKKMRNNPVLESHRLQPDKKDISMFDITGLLNGTGVHEPVFEAVLGIALEIGSEGREGHPIGTAFVIGDAANVMAKSRQLVLNPFEGHSREKRNITDPEIMDNIKEFAQLDGVFVISGDGVVEAAGRYITIDTAMARIQRGLGTRHSSVAAITSVTKALGVVVSQSGGVIRVFRDGKITATIRP